MSWCSRLIHIDDDELLYSPQNRKIGDWIALIWLLILPCVLQTMGWHAL